MKFNCQKKVKYMIMIEYILLSALGFAISLYTYLLELKVKRMPQYKPFCDISDKISCTKVMKSEYASLFYISNALFALVFYVFMFAFALKRMIIPLIIGSFGAFAVSLFLAYILYFKIKSFCLLCTSLYVTNLCLFLISLFYFFLIIS